VLFSVKWKTALSVSECSPFGPFTSPWSVRLKHPIAGDYQEIDQPEMNDIRL